MTKEHSGGGTISGVLGGLDFEGFGFPKNHLLTVTAPWLARLIRQADLSRGSTIRCFEAWLDPVQNRDAIFLCRIVSRMLEPPLSEWAVREMGSILGRVTTCTEWNVIGSLPSGVREITHLSAPHES